MPKIKSTRGSDISSVLVYENADGTPIDLTSATYRVFEEPEYLTQKITFSENTPSSGKVNMRIDWGDDIPDYTEIRNGDNARLPSFRVQMTIGPDDKGSEKFFLEYI